MLLRGKIKNVEIGKGFPVAVNVNIGFVNNDIETYKKEFDKIIMLSNQKNTPDLMMDLSLGKSKKYLYEDIKNIVGCPVGIIPHYFTLNDNGNIDKNMLLDEMERAAENGVGWFVTHFTPDKYMVSKSLNRNYPLSSRSAVIVIKDMIKNNRVESIYWEILDDIIKIAKKYSIGISLGAAFRPAETKDTLDEVHVEELKKYKEIITRLKKENVKVMSEGVGHCDIHKLDLLISYINNLDVPFMPLGPLFSDTFNEDDHIINALGFYSGIIKNGRFSVINAITPAEHRGGIPTKEDVLTGYLTAKACADLCNQYLNKFEDFEKNKCLDKDIYSRGCARCENICPTKFAFEEKEIIKKWITSK